MQLPTRAIEQTATLDPIITLNIKQLNIGANKGKARLWLQGADVIPWAPKTRYNRIDEAGQITLTLDPDGNRKVSGKGDTMPIIDMCGAKLASALGDTGTRVSIETTATTITITPIKGV